MPSTDLEPLRRSLLRPPADGVYDPNELDGLPEPVRRYFQASLAPGTPLFRSTRLRMHGHIRVGRWLPFRAEQVLTPLEGFVWWGRSAGVLSGFDRFAEGEGEMRWKLLGLVPVVTALGPDTDRSAAARGAAEGVWLPTALLPRFGVEWVAHDDSHVTASFRVGPADVDLHYEIDERGLPVGCRFDRWGDPDETGTFALHPFGLVATGHARFGGITIPHTGRVGWHHGTDRWDDDGEFFRYEITALAPAG